MKKEKHDIIIPRDSFKNPGQLLLLKISFVGLPDRETLGRVTQTKIVIQNRKLDANLLSTCWDITIYNYETGERIYNLREHK